jgi:hypothetical protein
MAYGLDIFEISRDGSPIWRGSAGHISSAIALMNELAAKTKNELRIINLSTNRIISSSRGEPRVAAD